jgi:hypothetical protein
MSVMVAIGRGLGLAARAGLVAAAVLSLNAAAESAPINAIQSAVQSAIQSARDDVQRRLRQRDWHQRDAAVSYCVRRFRSYDPYSMTYLGYDGLRHRCP